MWAVASSSCGSTHLACRLCNSKFLCQHTCELRILVDVWLHAVNCRGLAKTITDTPINTKTGAEAKNWKSGKPVRVVRNCKLAKHSKYAPVEGNRYDGIYKVFFNDWLSFWPLFRAITLTKWTVTFFKQTTQAIQLQAYVLPAAERKGDIKMDTGCLWYDTVKLRFGSFSCSIWTGYTSFESSRPADLDYLSFGSIPWRCVILSDIV